MDIEKIVKDAREQKEKLIESGLSQDDYDDALNFLEHLLTMQKK